jgi:hypothetical protein
VVVPDTGDAALPVLQTHQVLACARATEEGYHVVCRDVDDRFRVGFLPVHDEWGHATAKSWIADADVEKNTIRIVNPALLLPGSAVLARGERYAVTAATEGTYTVRYALQGYTCDVEIAKALAAPAAPTAEESDPARQTAARLQEAVTKSEGERDRLRKQLDDADALNRKLGDLVGALQGSDAEKVVLAAQLANARKAARKLGDYQAAAEQDLAARRKELAALVEKQGDTAAELRKTSVETGATAAYWQFVLHAETDIARLNGELARAQSELQALRRHGLDSAADKAQVQPALEAAQKDTATQAGHLRYESANLDLLTQLRDEVARVVAEGEALRESLKKVTQEVTALRQQLGTQAPPVN